MLFRNTHSIARIASVATVGAFVAVALGGCGTPGTSAQSSSAPKAISTEIPKDDVTLTLLHGDTSGTVEALAKGFEKLHPNVKVDVRFTAGDSYNTGLNLALSSNQAPDLAMLNRLGDTPEAGLIMPLDDYAKAYDWESKVPTSELDQWRADGPHLGTGKLWAAPAGFSLVGVYYNTSVAKKLGITQPKTVDEFEADLAKAKEAGFVPLQQPNQGGQSSYVFQALVNINQDPQKSTDWAFGKPGSTIENEAGTIGATTLADWASKGYIPESSNGTDGASAVAEFVKGNSLAIIDGNWDATTIDKALPGSVGFFTLPGLTPDAKSVGVGTSLAFAIPTKAKNPDLAAAFLDYFNTADAAAIQFANGYMPVAHADSIAAGENSVMSDYLTAWGKVGASNGLTPYFNNATPTMNDTLTSQGQQLIAGRIKPADYLKALQADWEGNQK